MIRCLMEGKRLTLSLIQAKYNFQEGHWELSESRGRLETGREQGSFGDWEAETTKMVPSRNKLDE